MLIHDDDTQLEAVAEPAPAAVPAKATSGNGRAKPAKQAKAKAMKAKPAKAKAVKAKPAKRAKGKAARQRDPAKLDMFGFRLGSIKSQAAALYAKGRGATLSEVKDAVGSVQFNLIAELEGRGFKFDRSEVKGLGPKMATRYKLHQK